MEPVRNEAAGAERMRGVALLGERVCVRWGGGEVRGYGMVVGYADQPTFLLNMDNGEQLNWVESLVEHAPEVPRPLTPPVPDVQSAETLRRAMGVLQARLELTEERLAGASRCFESAADRNTDLTLENIRLNGRVAELERKLAERAC